MPIYEYRCSACQVLNEFFLKVSDPHPEVCPSCGKSHTLQKQISQTSFSLKGDGWYVTDYKSKGGTAAATSDGAAEQAAPQAPAPSESPTSATVAPANQGSGSGSGSAPAPRSSAAAPSSVKGGE
jgi:putative FmdB family regulatory protein